MSTSERRAAQVPAIRKVADEEAEDKAGARLASARLPAPRQRAQALRALEERPPGDGPRRAAAPSPSGEPTEGGAHGRLARQPVGANRGKRGALRATTRGRRSRAVQGAQAPLGGGADLRMADAVPTAPGRLRDDGHLDACLDLSRDDPSDGAPPRPWRTAPTLLGRSRPESVMDVELQHQMATALHLAEASRYRVLRAEVRHMHYREMDTDPCQVARNMGVGIIILELDQCIAVSSHLSMR